MGSSRLYTILALLAALPATVYLQGTQNPPLATVENGRLVGKWESSRANTPYASFEGIPFAQPPARFESPKPALNWTGVRDARSTGSPCPQKDYYKTEDCLFLNVYVPKSVWDSNKRVATLVWIHGGSFDSGAGSIYGARYFMEQEVVLVTVNYRLGALGFLNSANGLVDGNIGLKDQILALKWVQRNVGFFNGNASSVTIFGESAGGVSVHELMISPASKGLFHKVIAQSGSALTPWAFETNPRGRADIFSRILNCGNSLDNRKSLDCIKRKSVREIIDAQEKTKDPQVTGRLWGPTLDGNAKDYSVLPKSPKELISAKYDERNSVNVPLIIGTTEEEGFGMARGILSNRGVVDAINANWNKFAPVLFQYEQYYANDRSGMDRVSGAIKKFYFDNEPLSNSKLQNLSNLITDVSFYMGMKHAALIQARTNQLVFTYNFRFRGNGLKDHGPDHANELQYFFNFRFQQQRDHVDTKASSREEEFSKNSVKIWTEFARTSSQGLRDNTLWRPLGQDARSTSSLEIFNMNDAFKMSKEEPEIMERWKFLKNVFKNSALQLDV